MLLRRNVLLALLLLCFVSAVSAQTCPPPNATKPVVTIDSSSCPTNGTASATGGWPSYQWSVINGTVTSGQGTANITFNGMASPVTLTVTGYDPGQSGCSLTSDPVTVPSAPAPVITLTTPDVCPYGSDTASVPAQYANYFWSINGGYISTGDGTDSITFHPGGGMPGNNDPVTLTVFVTDANGCP
ncbi:MAG: hypothetical protein ACRD3J_03990, partial [Thermoanaerobaculia bacterium]